MRIKRVAALWPCLFIFANAFSQMSDTSHTLHFVALQFGVNQVKDENLHPKVSTGTITQLAYGFEKRKTNYSRFQFSLGYSRLKTDLEDLSKSISLRLRPEYAYHYSLIQKDRLNYYLGPRVALDYSVCFFPNWDDSHLYWADYLSFGIGNILFVPLTNDKEWFFSLSIPLFTFYSRPDYLRPYKIDDTSFEGIVKSLHSDIRGASWDRAFSLQFDAEYRFPVFRTKREAFTYSFEYLRFEKPGGKAFTQLSHRIGIKILL